MPETERPEARGHDYRSRRRIVCDLDEDVFDEVTAAMRRNNCRSFAETVRLLIEWGLEIDKDDR